MSFIKYNLARGVFHLSYLGIVEEPFGVGQGDILGDILGVPPKVV